MQRSLPVLITLLLLFLTVRCNLNQDADFQKGMEAYEKEDYSIAEADFQKGLDAFEKKDYETALREWRPLAEQGLARAQGKLGTMYYDGKGVPQNDQAAVKWYRLSAELGYAPAQFNLGLMYARGRGVSQNDVYAYMWLNIAASRGYKRAVEVRGLAATVMAPSQIERAQDLASECVKKKFKGCGSSFTDPP